MEDKIKKWLIIAPVVTVLVCVLLLSGGFAYAATSVDGFNDSLLALLDGLVEYFKAVANLLEMIL